MTEIETIKTMDDDVFHKGYVFLMMLFMWAISLPVVLLGVKLMESVLILLICNMIFTMWSVFLFFRRHLSRRISNLFLGLMSFYYGVILCVGSYKLLVNRPQQPTNSIKMLLYIFVMLVFHTTLCMMIELLRIKGKPFLVKSTGISVIFTSLLSLIVFFAYTVNQRQNIGDILMAFLIFILAMTISSFATLILNVFVNNPPKQSEHSDCEENNQALLNN
ncbi:MAG: hypothetical protein BGN88_02225 [Clostridiales bacterium 43-6]|nr:MAG: hypothetical protein BGN88_02225 [Clostridiales bacterium 43-6]